MQCTNSEICLNVCIDMILKIVKGLRVVMLRCHRV